MGIISEKAIVRWNGLTKKYYENCGYRFTKMNEFFEVELRHLMKTSPVKIKVSCDYCGEIFDKPYRTLFNNTVSNVCCKNRKCMIKKGEEANLIKYGVTHTAKLDSYKDKSSERYRHDIEYVLKVAKSKSLSILNINDYKCDRSRLMVICSNHSEYGIQETNFANIKKNKHCCKYIRNDNDSQKLDGEFVKKEFIKRGFTPQFSLEEYINNSQPLPYTCDKHNDKGIQYRQYYNLKYANGCKYCRSERYKKLNLLDEDYVFGYFEERNLTVLDGETYEGKEKHIKFYCNKHDKEIQKTTYSSLKNTENPCKFCRNELSISSISRDLRSCTSKWKDDSEKECNFKCVITGSEDYDIHHLISFKTLVMESILDSNVGIKEIYDGIEIEQIKKELTNKHNKLLGVCLDKKLHIKFHQVYGKCNNTIEQFEEFKENYLSGEL